MPAACWNEQEARDELADMYEAQLRFLEALS